MNFFLSAGEIDSGPTMQQLHCLMDSLDVALWSYDLVNEVFDELSSPVTRMTGYAAEELSRLEYWAAVVHPEDWIHWRAMWTDLLSGHNSDLEMRILHAEGGVRWFLVKAAVCKTEEGRLRYQGLMVDITDRKQREKDKEMAESEAFDQRILQWIPEPIVIHREYQIVFANEAARMLIGASSSLTGRSLVDLTHPDYRGESYTRLEKVYRERETCSTSDLQIVRLDGSIVYAAATTAPVIYKGEDAALTVLRDITEQKRLLDRLQFAQKSLQIASDRYYRLQMKLDKFSSDFFGIVNVEELERRLIAEIREVLRVDQVCLIEADSDGSYQVKQGTGLSGELPASLYEWGRKKLPLCKLTELPDSCILRIGEIYGKMYLVWIGERSHSLELEPVRIWLETLCRYVSVLYDNFRALEDLTRELESSEFRKDAPSWLLRLMFRWNEHERKRLAQDLHDSALQEQIIWYRELDRLLMRHTLDPALRSGLERIEQGMLDVIFQIRHVCTDLRPPMLADAGLIASLESLFETTQLRADFAIDFHVQEFQAAPHEDISIGLYRIVQEMLANAAKHSKATKVNLSLLERDGWIELSYADNGLGMEIKEESTYGKYNMGICGMKERIRSMNGTAVFRSAPGQGLSILIRVPNLNHEGYIDEGELNCWKYY